MSEQIKTRGLVTITVPVTLRPCDPIFDGDIGWRTQHDRRQVIVINHAAHEMRITADDIGKAVLRAWSGETKATAPAKGYVVRGKYQGEDVYSYGPSDGFGAGAPEVSPRCIWDLDTAAGCRAFMVRRGCTDVTILAVAEDGTETPLPTYEEALAENDGHKATAEQACALLAQATSDVLRMSAEIERLRGVAPILTDGVPAIMHSSAPASREEIGAAACQMLKAIERALSVLQGSGPMPTDPLAALEAAERRLLEADGWLDKDGDGRWREKGRETFGWCERRDAIEIAKKQLRAKGGA